MTHVILFSTNYFDKNEVDAMPTHFESEGDIMDIASPNQMLVLTTKQFEYELNRQNINMDDFWVLFVTVGNPTHKIVGELKQLLSDCHDQSIIEQINTKSDKFPYPFAYGYLRSGVKQLVGE